MMRRGGLPVAELPDLRTRYALVVRLSGGRTLFTQTIAFDKPAEGQKVTALPTGAGGGGPEHVIDLGVLPVERDAAFPAAGINLELPYRYRVTGSRHGSGEFDDTFTFDLHTEEAAWEGRRLTLSSGFPVPTEHGLIEVSEDAVTLPLVEFTSGRDEPGAKVANRFAFRNVPRRYTVDLGPKAGQVFVYWAKGNDLMALLVAKQSDGRYEAMEDVQARADRGELTAAEKRGLT